MFQVKTLSPVSVLTSVVHLGEQRLVGNPSRMRGVAGLAPIIQALSVDSCGAKVIVLSHSDDLFA